MSASRKRDRPRCVKVTLWPTSGTKSEMLKSALGGAATAVCATASGHSTATSTAKERLRGDFMAPPRREAGSWALSNLGAVSRWRKVP